MTPLSDPPRRDDITALCVLASPILNANRKVIIERAAALRLPAIYQLPEVAWHPGRPRPVPPYLLAVAEEAWENSWNSLPIRSGVIPIPVFRQSE
jgi:hypothetical protein